MSKEYVNYHKHCHYSNLAGTADSTVKPIDYINRAKELGHSVVSCVQHSSPFGYFEYYDLCKQYDMKFLFGVEAYFTELDNKEDKLNSHLCIIAKKESAFKSINHLLSRANKENFYYKARIALEWILELDKDEVIITSACVGSFWKRENYEEIALKLHNKFKDNFYLELQYHETPSQIDVNTKIMALHEKYGINIIVGCDSHMISESQKVDRDAFLYAKGIVYEDEDGWFLDYPTYDEIIERFKKQGVVPFEKVEEAMNNTLIFKDVEDIHINKDIKLPSIHKDKTQKQKNEILFNIIKEELVNKFGDMKNVPKNYQEAVLSELRVVKETNMADYFILNYHIIKRGKELGGYMTTTGRGSAPSWYINSLLGFSTIDRLDCPIALYPERFATADRILAGSLFDIDFNISDRKPFMQAQNEVLGDDNAYWFSAYGKLKTKSAWKMYAKSNNIPFEISNNVTKYIDEYEIALKYADDEEKDNILPENFIPSEYIEIFNGSKKYFGIIDSISVHPCAFLLLDTPISSNIGLIKVGDEFCANIEGSYADKYMFVKNDLLAVTVVDIISKTFEKIKSPIITTSELIAKTKGDSKVWDIYKNGYTMCLNQVEQPKTRLRIMKYSPKNISELSFFVGAIRPSFQSMLDIFLNRQDFSYGIEAFDGLLRTEELPQSFLIMQEQLMLVLKYAGFEISETYQLMKSIAKKKQGVVEKIKERFVSGFSNVAKCDTEKTLSVWKILEDSSSYLFNASHSLSVALDSLYGAYLKAYYPLEFYTTCIEIYTDKKNKKKLSSIKEEMRDFGIFEGDLKFGENNSETTFDKDGNLITQLLGSIKDINSKCALELYNISKAKNYENFLQLLIDENENKILQSNQLSILIKLDYFSDFGKSQYLMDIVQVYDNLNGRKQIKKDQLEKFGLTYDIMERHANSSTTKMYKDFDCMAIMKEMIESLEDRDISLKEKISHQLEYLGYIQYRNDTLPKSIYYVLETKFYDKYKEKPYLKLYRILDGETISMKIKNSNEFNNNHFQEKDIIKIEGADKEQKTKKNADGKYEKVAGEFNLVLTKWKVL